MQYTLNPGYAVHAQSWVSIGDIVICSDSVNEKAQSLLFTLRVSVSVKTAKSTMMYMVTAVGTDAFLTADTAGLVILLGIIVCILYSGCRILHTFQISFVFIRPGPCEMDG
jgi:hypothetical protein